MAVKNIKKLLSLLFVAVLVFLFSCTNDQPTEPISDPQTDYQTIEGNKGTVGKAGGKLTINDPNSSLNGTYVEIPEGALTDKKEIKISEAPSSIKKLDTKAIIVNFEPEGTVFDKPIYIGLPIKKYSSKNNVKVFYFNNATNKLEQVAVKYVDVDKGIARVETDHFSYYLAEDTESFITANMGIELLNIDGKIGVRIDFLGSVNDGLENIPLSLGSSYSIMDKLKDEYSQARYVFIDVLLSRDEWGKDPDLGIISFRLDLGRPASPNTFYCAVNCDDNNNYSNESNYRQIYKSKNMTASDENLNNWFAGKTLIAKFKDFNPNQDDEYYVTVFLVLIK